MSAPAPQAVVIGTSAGAVQALSRLLPLLPASYPLPVMVVVHVPPDRRNALTDLFQTKCRMTVREADDKEPIEPGVIYFAPPDYHLQVETTASFSLSTDEPVLHSRPSIDVLFESAADAFGAALLGVVLTGANQDGAAGAKAIGQAGGVVLVEDPAQAQASTMPEAALDACDTARPMSIEAIGSYLLGLRG
jgi:two-component system chemotaxis response regulator CheB